MSDTTATANPLLSVRDLKRHFSVRAAAGSAGMAGRWWRPSLTLRAVDGISFDLAPGRTLGLVGESGCGKSTTARLVLGLQKPSAGTVRFEGQDVPSDRGPAWRALRQRMQMVYQDPLSALDRRLPVLDQVAEPLLAFGIGNRQERREQASRLMAEVGLTPHLLQRYPHELSGGQRQRVVLARALILNPGLLVCDEPVSALDVSIQAQVINLLRDLQDRLGLGYLFISHDLKVVRLMSHEVAVMYLGRIVERATPQDLFAQPLHPYTQALVSAVPTPWQRTGKPRIVLQGDPPNPVHQPSGCAFHPRCQHALPRCREQAPGLREVAPGRQVACHLLGEGSSSASRTALNPDLARPESGVFATPPAALLSDGAVTC